MKILTSRKLGLLSLLVLVLTGMIAAVPPLGIPGHNKEGPAKKLTAKELKLCVNQNRFLFEFGDRGVDLFEEKTNSTTQVCRHEWVKHGTCCKADSIMEYARIDEERIRASIAKVQTEFRSFSAFVDSARKSLVALEVAKNFEYSDKFPFIKANWNWIQQSAKATTDLAHRLAC